MYTTGYASYLYWPCCLGNDELITKNGANKLYNHHCLQMEHEESFHIAVDGRTFTIIKDYFPELFKRVSNPCVHMYKYAESLRR